MAYNLVRLVNASIPSSSTVISCYSTTECDSVSVIELEVSLKNEHTIFLDPKFGQSSNSSMISICIVVYFANKFERRLCVDTLLYS